MLNFASKMLNSIIGAADGENPAAPMQQQQSLQQNQHHNHQQQHQQQQHHQQHQQQTHPQQQPFMVESPLDLCCTVEFIFWTFIRLVLYYSTLDFTGILMIIGFNQLYARFPRKWPVPVNIFVEFLLRIKN